MALHPALEKATVQSMTLHRSIPSVVAVVLGLALATRACTAAPPTAANAGFDTYIHTMESRIATQHTSADRFVILPSSASARSLQGDPVIERIAVTQLPGALLHHWRATQFIPGAKAADLDRLLRDFSAYPKLFAPQVERAQATAAAPGHLHVTMRLLQHHVITVVLDTDYDVAFVQLDPQHRYSISHSTQVREIDSPGTSAERALSPDQEHGLLWRQNTYWSYEERDGGLYVQVESVSLTRAVPTGLGWAVGSYIGTIPRDSLAFTLSCVTSALLHPAPAPTQTPISSANKGGRSQ